MRVNSVREVNAGYEKNVANKSFARRILFRTFEDVVFGRLIISEEGQVSEFGQSAELALFTARIDVTDNRLYSLVLSRGIIGAAEAFMQGYWHTPDLVNVVRLMVKNMDMLDNMDTSGSLLRSAFLKIFALLHVNDLEGSRKNISAHYDLGNDFFKLFLDPSMMYSSAVYENDHDSLDQAAEHKLDIICQKLSLSVDDHVIEIGTGWGGFACYAAKHYGCKVTTTTISKEQFDLAVDRVKREGLEDKVEVLFEDYRKLEGQYDKLVSIEMIEAVGHEYYQEYFAKCSDLLKPEGQMLIQAILMSDQRYDKARKSVDFIKRYIFPGGCLPSVHEISKHVANSTDMQTIDVHDITYDYAKTLAAWREAFFEKLPEVKEQGFSDEFIRMWDFYFCYCQGGFMERVIHTAQFVFAKPHWRDPRYPEA